MGNSLQTEIVLIIIGALIFTASFLWKDLLKEIEAIYFPKTDGISGRILYTIFITLVLVSLAIYLRHMFNIDQEKNDIKFDDSPISRDESHSNIEISDSNGGE